MALSRDYKETIRQRIERDPEFKQLMLEEAINCFFTGEPDIGKSILRDFIKATVGFEELSKQLDKKPESIIRMFSPSGNPTVKNFFCIIDCIQKSQGLYIQPKLSKHATPHIV